MRSLSIWKEPCKLKSTATAALYKEKMQSAVLLELEDWNEEQRQKCLNCKWHADIETED